MSHVADCYNIGGQLVGLFANNYCLSNTITNTLSKEKMQLKISEIVF